MGQIKILVAEDDPHIRTGLVDTLESEGYHVMEAGDGEKALALFESKGADLILLDVMMPKKSGYDVLSLIRKENEQVPIIMLTAKSEEIDKVVGLKLGADDYITKPFGVHELLARISAVLRRTTIFEEKKGSPKEDGFNFGRFKVNTRTFQLEDKKNATDISERELTLLRYFSNHPGEVLSRDTLLNAAWGIDYLGTTRTLDQHIAVLRKKIEQDPAHPKLITTVHGIGYRYNG